jgi:hypothetical protein
MSPGNTFTNFNFTKRVINHLKLIVNATNHYNSRKCKLKIAVEIISTIK